MTGVEEQRLLEAATEARTRAYAPYSGFNVGAAVLCASGNIYLGCNVENAAYPSGMCAERCALGAAVAAGEREFVALAVIAETARPVAPCGMCRQVIAELAPHARIILANLAGDIEATTPQALLPGAFGPADLT